MSPYKWHRGKGEKLRENWESRRAGGPAALEKVMIGWDLRSLLKSCSAPGTSANTTLPGFLCGGLKLLCCGRFYHALGGKYRELWAE